MIAFMVGLAPLVRENADPKTLTDRARDVKGADHSGNTDAPPQTPRGEGAESFILTRRAI
jgi:hypothetical protein